MRRIVLALLVAACACAGACASAGEEADASVTGLADAARPDVNVGPDAGPTFRVVVNAVGPGTLAVAPAGAACGPGCVGFDVPTTVTITPLPDVGLSVESWVGGGCPTASQAPCTVGLSTAGTTTVTVNFCKWNYVVDPMGGADGNQGICASPWKTLTKAMTRATTGQSVHMYAGTASAATGETFPVGVPAGVTLVGDETVKGLGIGPMKIDANVANALSVAAGATVAGLWVHGARCVEPMGDAVIIRNNTITGCTLGVYSNGRTNLQIIGNAMPGNSTGMAFVGGNAAWTGKAEGNVISGGTIGVEFDNPAIDFGGGPGGSAGGNSICGNTRADVWTDIASTGQVWVQSNKWDHATPSVGTAPETTPPYVGIDIFNRDGAAVMATPSSAVATCP